MGRVTGPVEPTLNMKLTLGEVRSLRDLIAKEVGGLEWFLFGSSALCGKCPNDIDLLVLCESDLEADKTRQILQSSSIYPLLDVSILTREEEEEGRFVRERRAIPL